MLYANSRITSAPRLYSDERIRRFDLPINMTQQELDREIAETISTISRLERTHNRECYIISMMNELYGDVGAVANVVRCSETAYVGKQGRYIDCYRDLVHSDHFNEIAYYKTRLAVLKARRFKIHP